MHHNYVYPCNMNNVIQDILNDRQAINNVSPKRNVHQHTQETSPKESQHNSFKILFSLLVHLFLQKENKS